jgi:hypothetical protein
MSNFSQSHCGGLSGWGARCESAVGDGSPPERLGSGHLFQLAARSFRSTRSGERLSLRVSGIPTSRSRVFVISARPNCRGFGPGPSINVPITEHTS